MIKKIVYLFLFWRVCLFIVAFLAVFFIPTFGKRFPYYNVVLMPTNLPAWVWGFGNFDGVHYLRIAQNGYNAQYSQAFFPLYPLIIHFLDILNKNPTLDTGIFVDPSYFFVGFILSNIFFLLALITFYKLMRIDFSQKIAFGSLILLVSFPTSFYFGSVYTESLFLLLATLTFYLLRRNNFILAGITALLASSTRIIGLLFIPVILIEFYFRLKEQKIGFNSSEAVKILICFLLVPFGTLLYMLYLRFNFDNPLYFLTSQPLFGAERTSESLVFLPQVIYRYIKIFTTVPIASQLFFNAFLEFIFTVVTVTSILFFFKKMRISYLVFTLGCLILPTFTGTLSSMPRYSLMGFLVLPLIVQYTKGHFKFLTLFFIAIGILLMSLFIRGYWIA